MKRLMFALVLFTGADAIAFTQTDYACMNQCQARGSGYQWCQSRCQYDPAPAAPSGFNLPDYACVRQCQASGGGYAFCQQRCG